MYELIVVGASWGGLDAAGRLLADLPDAVDAPVVLAQHRHSNSTPGGLAELLHLRIQRPVQDAEDKMAIERGKVYIAPPDYHLLVEPECFALSTEGMVQHSRPSIDVLFDSAADTYADELVAVVLTGANADGAYGLERVKRRGGVAIVQDPATAEKREMPDAAIATGVVDHVLPLEEIAAKLVELAA
jgi:two-component system chemotaxis response regulator CheB